MVDLIFSCIGAESEKYAAVPTIRLNLRVDETTGSQIFAIALRCQLRIVPSRRHYDDREAEAVVDLFGERARWGETLRPLQLAFVNQMVPGFRGSTEVSLQLLCSYDFDVAAHKYMYALDDGNIPLLLLFNGTIFTGGKSGIAMFPVAWHKECSFDLPVALWKETMDRYLGGTAWLRLRQDTFDALYRYRAEHSLLSWDDAVERLMKEHES